MKIQSDKYFINEIEKGLKRIIEKTGMEILFKNYDKNCFFHNTNCVSITFKFNHIEYTTFGFRYQEPFKMGQVYINKDFENVFYSHFGKYID